MDEEAVPILRVANAATAVVWYQRLGFTKEWEYRFDPDCPPSCRSRVAGRGCSCPNAEATHDTDTWVGLFVTDIDAIVAEFGRPKKNRPTGTNSNSATPVNDNPDGNRLRITKRAT